MSFQEYQNIWVKLSFDDFLQEKVKNKEVYFANLTKEENLFLQELDFNRFKYISQINKNSRVKLFLLSIPKTFYYFIKEEELEKLAKEYSLNNLEKNIYPYKKDLTHYFKFILSKYKKEKFYPYFYDLVNYEISLLKLEEYFLPRIKKNNFPVLDKDYCLLKANEHLEEMLFLISKNKEINHLDTINKKGYLINKNFIEKLTWYSYELLLKCNGKKTWENIVKDFIIEEPELLDYEAKLISLGDYYIKHNILL
ncbi:MAG: hypothetical protein U0457_02830 [Candidatus Sericytochromatia bacterium]